MITPVRYNPTDANQGGGTGSFEWWLVTHGFEIKITKGVLLFPDHNNTMVMGAFDFTPDNFDSIPYYYPNDTHTDYGLIIWNIDNTIYKADNRFSPDISFNRSWRVWESDGLQGIVLAGYRKTAPVLVAPFSSFNTGNMWRDGWRPGQ